MTANIYTHVGLVTLLIYKVLKPTTTAYIGNQCLVTLLIYKVLKPLSFCMVNCHKLSYFTDLQGSQTPPIGEEYYDKLSYFTDLQGSQT